VIGLADRVAGAPITWGVCEVPGWGHQMTPERVLTEMAAIGLRATELGPRGFLPTHGVAGALAPYGLELVGGFLPAVLHRTEALDDSLARAASYADLLGEAGADVLVLACAAGEHGYDTSTEIDDGEWATLVEGIGRVVDIAGERGLAVGVHPHYGTVIQAPHHVERLLDSSAAALCVDTGHLMVGGTDPLDVVRSVPGRVAHVHMKDVDEGWAEQVRAGRLTYADAVRNGMYRPLGKGDLDVAAIVETLEEGGYRGWFVLEQDTVLQAAPEEGAGPVAGAAESFTFLRRLAAEVEHGEQDSGQEGRSTRAAHGATS
jgi:inosose dehydratase